MSLASANARLLGVARGDRAGYAAGNADDYDGDGTPDVFVGADAEDSGGNDAGALYVVTDVAAGDTSLDDAYVKFVGEAGDQAGYAAAATGDGDGDGLGDLVVGAPENDDGGRDAGAAWFVVGASGGVVSLADASAKFTGEDASDGAGSMVASSGDADGDGFDDLLVGAPHDDGAATNAGAAWLLLGGPGW